MPDFNKVVDYVKQNVEENDIIITLGAGTVTNIGPMLLDQIIIIKKEIMKI